MHNYLKTLSLLLLFISTSSSAYTVGPTTPGKWGSPILGTGAAITYSFMTEGASLANFMPVGFESEIGKAFDAWSSVADLTFTNVVDDGAAFDATTLSGDIRFGGHSFDGAGGVLAHGFFPPANGNSAAGDIHFDTAETWGINGIGGLDIFWVALHEIGHALGLGHSDVAPAVMGAFYDPSLASLQEDDKAGIQYLYGAPAVVPIPAAFWLFASGLLGFLGMRKKKQ